MQETQCTADLTSVSLQDLCLWSDQSMGWDEPDIGYDDPVDKAGKAGLPQWHYVPARERRHEQCGHGALSFQRVRVRLSALHPSLRDFEFWTLDLRSTVMLFIVLVVLVSFGAALFA